MIPPVDGTFSNFEKFIGTPVERYILPAIPSSAGDQLSPLSKIKPDQLGKIPGMWRKDDKLWRGFHQWETFWHHSTPTALRAFEAWQLDAGFVVIPVCMATREYIAVDLDTDDERVATWFLAKIEVTMGVTMVIRRRVGNKTRMVLFFKHQDNTAYITKHAIKLVDPEGKTHLLEILGDGQHVVIEGPHFKGAMQYWQDGGLVEHAHELPNVDVHKCVALINAIRDDAPSMGLTVVKGSLHAGGGERAEAHKIGNVLSPHYEGNRERLTRAIQHISLDDERIDYETFIKIQRAILAAVGGDLDYMREVVWPWVCESQTIARGEGPRTEERGIEWLEARWVSFHDSTVGATTVYEWAALCGYDEALSEARGEELPGIFGLPDPDDDGSGVIGNGGGGGGGGNGSSGPLPEPDTHSKIADDLVPALRPEWRYHVQEQVWYHYREGRWHRNESVIEAIKAHCDALADQVRASNGANASLRARVLQSYGTWNSIKRALESLNAMRVHESEFDADAELLNTPRGVVNLRTGALLDHNPDFLMRHMTRVSPALELWYENIGAPVDYRARMPWFWRVVDNVAMNPQGTSHAPGEHREWVTDAIQLAFADAIIGKLMHQAILFVQGLPGVGKTQIFEALFKILGAYAKRLKPAYICKTADGKRFDDHDLAGKRFYFCDETQQGSTLDETLLCTLSGTDEITSDVKFGRPVSFVNRGNLVIVGNHRPHFISHEAGGLSSRLLLLEAGGIDYREPVNGGTDDLAEIVVREEGSVLLLWAIEAAMQELQGTSDWKAKVAPMRASAKAYTRENSPVVRWVEDRQMVLSAEAEIPTTQAFKMFQHYAREANIKSVDRMTVGDFRQALKAAFPDLLLKKGPLKRHNGLSYVFGLGAPGEGAFGEGSNVTLLRNNSDVNE
jgi:P4 family phage/plasmid primase-like protien